MSNIIEFPKRKANAEDIAKARADFKELEKINKEKQEKLAAERAAKNKKVLRELRIK